MEKSKFQQKMVMEIRYVSGDVLKGPFVAGDPFPGSTAYVCAQYD